MGAYNLNYFRGMDKYLSPYEENRFLEGETKGSAGGPRLSKPIVSIKKLGATFVGNRTNFGSDILGGLVANIRKGSSTLQLAGLTSQDLAFTGKSRRQAIKEALKASGFKLDGMEFAPNQEGGVAGLSGFDFKSGQFNNQRRETDKQHIRDAIRFSAEIGAGGGVDIWSREFSRSITGKFKGFVDFEGAKPDLDQTFTIVDKETGRPIHQFQTGQLGGQNSTKITIPKLRVAEKNSRDANGVLIQKGDYLDAAGNKLTKKRDKYFVMNSAPVWDDKKQKFESLQMDWNEFQSYAKKLNNDFNLNLRPEEWVGRLQLEQAYSQQRAQAIYSQNQYKQQKERYIQVQELKKNENKIKQEKQQLTKSLNKINTDIVKLQKELETNRDQEKMTKFQSLNEEANRMREFNEQIDKQLDAIKHVDEFRVELQYAQESSSRADAQADAAWNNVNKIQSMEEYGKKKTFESYAELGIEAMRQTQTHDVTSPIYVGPELGWPEGYGGHTNEFIEIVRESRKTMVEQMKRDPKLRSQFNDEKMKEMAKKHIKGIFDTSHLSMWYNHFPKKNEHETEDERLKRFNKWYLKQVDKLAEADVVGSVQIVDSGTGEHSHIPIGEGIFPTVEAMKRFQEKGFKGNIVSEGHFQEDIDPGSTQFSLWNEFGASIGSRAGYFSTPGRGNSFGNIYSLGGVAGYSAPVNYIVGAYSPSNDWKLWSGTPLE